MTTLDTARAYAQKALATDSEHHRARYRDIATAYAAIAQTEALHALADATAAHTAALEAFAGTSGPSRAAKRSTGPTDEEKIG